MFKGLYVALVTPFKKDGSLNEAKLRELVQFHIQAGTNGLVPCATTSENPTYTWEEHFKIIDITVKEAKGKIKICAGCGTNSTAKSLENVKKARELGADAAMVVTPYYNKPTPEGLYAHFMKLADEGGLPLMLYNVPGRTGLNMLPKTVQRLAAHDRIAAIKEASGSLEQMAKIRNLVPKEFLLISGDDALTLPVMAIGGVGIISVVANIIPRDVAEMCAAFDKGEIARAQALHYKMLSLVKAMFIETNPIPVKTAMGLMKMIDPALRLPMCEMEPANKEKLVKELKAYKLI